jgi:hypothetical protein
VSTKDTGGPAFPCSHQNTMNGFPTEEMSGMTLRDAFAIAAVQAVPMPQDQLHDIAPVYDRIARHAYKMADSMLEARK